MQQIGDRAHAKKRNKIKMKKCKMDFSFFDISRDKFFEKAKDYHIFEKLL